MNNGTIINSKQSLEAYKKFLDLQFEQHKFLRLSMKTGKTRTLTQNAALHVFCAQLADALNDGGFDIKQFFKDTYCVPFTAELVKNNIWRPMQLAVTGKKSSTKPTTGQYAEIYDCLNVKLAEYGLFVPWPSKENLG